MMFALVSIIYPRITTVGQYSDIREHLQNFNVDYLRTSKIDIPWLCSKHSVVIHASYYIPLTKRDDCIVGCKMDNLQCLL